MNKSKRIGRMVFCLIVSFVMIMTLIPRMPAGLAYAAAGDTPPHSKTLADNGDGTYTISLDVVGESEKKPNNVNVVVVFDTSGSMTTSRMNAAKTAVNSLASSLFAYNTSSAPNTVEMALVDFSTDATTAQAPTNSETTFNRAVRNLSAEGGTNWEAALKQAKNVDFGDDDQTFVIFVSDGNPTFRDTRGNYDRYFNYYGYRIDDWQYYNSEGVYGTGSDDYGETVRRCYNEAVDDAKALATSVGTDHFFAIGAFGNVDRMEQLTDDAGSDSTTNYYNASDTAALNQAISDILAKIEMSGIANASIDDGTTNQVKTTSGEVAELLEVDESSFKYYKGNSTWADAPEAHLVNGAVEWDISEAGVLENGVRYRVTFDCYPSQYTYDTIAKLKNGDITYDSLDPEVKKYIVDNGGGSYSLLTNTNATLSYDDTRDDADQKTVDYKNPDPVATGAATMSVTKAWENELDARAVGKIDMTVLMDKAKFHDVTLSKDDDPAWTKDNIFISPGIIKNGQVLKGAEGHDFTFAELGSEQYNWELVAPTVHPMIIDGTLTMLTMVDEAHSAPSGAKTYTINNKTYFSNGSSAASLDAYNYRRSNLNLTKVVTGEDAPKDATFPFTLTVNNGKASTGSADDTNSDYYVWFSIYDTNAGATVKDATVTGATAEAGNTGYYYAPSGSPITVQMKDGWNLRFTNLPTDTTYTFAEGDLAEGFAFNKAELTSGTGKDSTFNPGKTTTGTVEATNTTYTVTFTNDYELTDLKITKVWEDNNNQDGKRLTADELKAKLTLSPAVEGKEPTVVDNGNNTYTITYTGLPRFSNDKEVTYEVTESAVNGYTTTGSPAKDHGTITNSHTPEVTDITVNKEWVGPEATGGASITLMANGTEVSREDNPVTLSGDNGNEYTWGDLPKYANGTAITYTVEEAAITGYSTTEPTGTGTAEDPFVFTNTNDETVDVPVTKVWVGPAAESGATIHLMADGTDTGKSVTLPDADGKNTYTFEDLRKYDAADGHAIVYTVTEDKIAGYTTAGPTGDAATGFTFTNTNDERTTVSVKKVWDDDNNRDGARPDSVTVNLKANGADATQDGIVAEQQLTAEGWTYTWSNLYKYDQTTGAEITYTVTEESVEGYTPKDNDPAGTGTTNDPYVFTNTHTPGKTSVTVTKSWSDENDRDGIRPDSVEVTLLANDEEVTQTGITATVELNEENQWTYTWTGLNEKDNGQAISYTVQEETTSVITGTDGPGTYAYAVTGSATEGYTVTNTHTPETVNVPVEKVWEDAEDQDGFRPDSVEVTLKANNGAVTQQGITAAQTLSDDNEWAYTWTGLYKFENGQPISYTVQETTTSVITGTNGTGTYAYAVTGTAADGYTVTNTHTPEKTEVTVNKIWEGDDAWKDSVRPDSITVNLMADGEPAVDYDGKAVPAATVKADDEGNWTYTFTNLPKYKDGNAIVYTSEEAAVAGYDTTYSNDKLTITNTYNPTPTIATFDVTKNLVVPEGLAGPDEWSYKFKAAPGEGAPAPAAAEQTVDQDKTTATFTFAENAFTKPGTYTYTVTEEGTYAYITNDAAAATGKTVTVIVTGNKQGTLTAAVTGADEGGETTTFTNTYAIITPDTVDPPVKKNLAGTELSNYDGQFTFKIEGKSAPDGVTDIPMPANTEITNSAEYLVDGFYEFGEIEYTVPGTYTYEISEVSGTIEEITYDTTKYPMTVNVVDNGDGSVTATMTPAKGSFVFNNSYSAEGSATLEATKVLEGREWKEGETFTFELRDANGATVGQPVQVSKDNPTASFNVAYTLEDVGEHKYTITETNLPANEGLEKSADIEATVTVADAGEGVLSTDVAYTDNVKTITNTYTATAVNATVNVSKTIDGYIAGEDKNGNVVDRKFNFTMTGPKIDGELTASITTSGGQGTTAFDEIQYTLADMVDEEGNYVKTKDFVYTVTETAGDDDGFSYDSNKYTVTVTVTDDQKGTLSSTVKYTNEDQTSVEVVNEYEMTDVDVTLTLTKTIDDQSNSAPDGTFKFKLYKDSVSEDNFVEEKTITTKGLTGSVDFSELTFDAAGEYTYVVVEEAGDVNGFTYDTTEHTYKIVVDNDFEAAVLEINNDDSTLAAEITNVYKATAVSNALKVKKEVNDTSGSAYDTTFTFTLTDVNGEEPKELGTVTVEAGEEGTFEAINYEKAGTYEYTIKETEGNDPGYQYDTTAYKVTVTVEDVEGQLVATAAYVNKEGEALTSLTVTNTYDPEDAKIALEARKVVDDKTGGATAKTFTFELVDAEGKVISTKSIQGGGTVQFDEQTYSKVGEYKYNIHEVKGSDKGYTYDTKDYPVTVTVTDPDKDGRLKAEATEGAEVVITNTYKADPTKATIELTKELTGRDMNEGEFTFTLTDLNGEEPDPIQTATNTADGKVTFNEIEYTVSGEFNYEVSEVVPEETKGVTYDQNKIKVTVKVTDDGEGALKAEVVYPAGSTFKNVYEATGSFTPEAKKILTGKALADGQFSFKIEGPEVNETVKNKADGTVTFGALSFDQTDAGKTYEYTITEVNDKQANVTYDGKKVTLKVTITDNGDGTLKVTGEYSGQAEFNNKYEEPPAKTGDTTVIAPYIVIGAASLALLLMLLFRRRKAN